MKEARNSDAVAMALLERAIDSILARGVKVLLCGVRQGLYRKLEMCGLANKVGEENIFLERPVRLTSTLLAVRHACELVENPCPTCPSRRSADRPRELFYEH